MFNSVWLRYPQANIQSHLLQCVNLKTLYALKCAELIKMLKYENLCVCVCVYIYIYTHTHTHTHTYIYCTLQNLEMSDATNHRVFYPENISDTKQNTSWKNTPIIPMRCWKSHVVPDYMVISLIVCRFSYCGNVITSVRNTLACGLYGRSETPSGTKI